MFVWENAIALPAMQGNQGSYRGAGEVLCVFSCSGLNPVYILELRRGSPFETRDCSAKSGHMSRYDGHLRNLN